MTPSTIVRLLLVLGRVVACSVALLSTALMVLWGYGLLRYLLFSENPTSGEVGFIPLVIILRIIVAVWVAWSVLKSDARPLLRDLLLAGFGSFFGLYGWYFMLVGRTGDLISLDNLTYLAAIGDLFYVVAGLLVGCALLLSCLSARLESDVP